MSQFELKIVSLLEIRKSLSISSFPENLTFTLTEDLFQAFTSTCSGSEGVARRLGERASLRLIHDPRAHLYQPMPAPKQFRQIAISGLGISRALGCPAIKVYSGRFESIGTTKSQHISLELSTQVSPAARSCKKFTR